MSLNGFSRDLKLEKDSDGSVSTNVYACVYTTGLHPTLSLKKALKPLNSKSAQDEEESGIFLQPLC